MKITASFLPPWRNWAPALLAVLTLAGLFSAGVAAWFATDGLGKHRDNIVLRTRLADLDSRLRDQALIEPLPPVGEMAEMKQRIAAINALTESRGWPAPLLLARLEEWLPDEVSLVSVRHRVKDGEAVLIAESDSAETLTAFLQRLEKEPHFSEVLLSRQGNPSARDAKLLQFELRLKERP